MGAHMRGRSWASVIIVVASALAALEVPVWSQLSWDRDAWRIRAADARLEHHMGRDALFLESGTAWMDGASFVDGVIEFDMATSGAQGFHGVRFRASDDGNHEHIYVRPHLSGKPDAAQYNPVYNGVSSWQIFADARYVQPLVIPSDRWVHVRVGVRGRRAEVSLDGGEPIVFPHLIREPTAGPVGVDSSGAPAWFANVQVRPGVDPGFTGGDGAPAPAAPVGSVTRWRVSDAFAESDVDGVAELPDTIADHQHWTVVNAEDQGITNLAKARTRTQAANTVFAAVTLHSDGARTVPVSLGFSDRVRVFLNGRQLFAGADEYASRDYRFLGTVGLFDTVFLPLEDGENELWLAVSEDFGGWGVALQIGAQPGVEVKEVREAYLRPRPELGPGHTIVTVLCDRGERYLSLRREEGADAAIAAESRS